MKKIISVLFVLLTAFWLTGCGENPPALEDRVAEDQGGVQMHTGVVKPFELSLYQDGTHQLLTDDGETLVIQSRKINLNLYLGKTVTVSGSLQKLIDNKSEVFTVEAILSDESDTGEKKSYNSATYGFSFDYPALWELIENGRRLALRHNGADTLVMDVLDSDQEIGEFVASREAEDGTPVTVASQRSIRYTAGNEIRLYVPDPSRAKVFRLVFKGDATEKQAFYSLLETFSIQAGKTKEGEKCGGEESLTCPEGFRCELTSDSDLAEGICVSVDEMANTADCPFVATPAGCTNYRPKSLNANNCPTSYECLDEPAPSKTDETASNETVSEAQTSDEPVPTGLVAEGTEAVAAFRRNEDALLPSGSSLVQVELVKEQNLIAAVYTLDGQKFRALFEYSRSADDFSFKKIALYKAGEERDWELVEGENATVDSEKIVIKADDTAAPLIVAQDMRLYENSHKNFSLQYPKNWYYRSFGPIENTVWTVGFADKPLDDISQALITVKIVDEDTPATGDRFSKTVTRDDTSHFVIEGPLDMKETIERMAETVRQD